MSVNEYPDYLFRDPLLSQQYLNNTRVGTPINQTNIIDINVDGDDLLQLYINVLDEEIFSETPEGLSDIADAFWESDDLQGLSIKMLDESRKHGWCVVQFYDENALQRWRVFSVVEFSDYIKETYEDEDGNQKTKLVGMKFEWGDYLGNHFKEEVKFEDKFTHLIKFKEGDNKMVFAFPDLSQAIMTLAFEIRQIKGQLTYSAAKPSYQHFKYGEAATDENITDLDNKLKGVNTTSAIGVPIKVLDEIVTIKNENLDVIEPAFDKAMKLFAGATRLPLSFYMGEKDNTGMSDMGEKSDILKVALKKINLFTRYETYIKSIFDDVYGISLGDLKIPQEESIAEVEEKEAGADNPDTNKQDE